MEIDIGYTTIRAPFNGVVEERPVEIGDFVNVGDASPASSISIPCWSSARCPSTISTRSRSACPARPASSRARPWKGKVRFVGSTADAKTRTFRVELEVPNPARTIVQGVSAELHLPVADLPAHRVSPAILTLAENGDVGVKTVGPGNIVEFHAVTIVATGADGVWLAGLPPTVTFITVGQDFVTAGQKVEPVPEGAQPQS